MQSWETRTMRGTKNLRATRNINEINRWRGLLE